MFQLFQMGRVGRMHLKKLPFMVTILAMEGTETRAWLKSSYSVLQHVPLNNVDNRIGTLVKRSPRAIPKNSTYKMALMEYIYSYDLDWYKEWVSVKQQATLEFQNVTTVGSSSSRS